MPEIKHNFTTGKMNKDLNERLVPNGEYRDAMNIQISNSDGSDVGTIQNILGNSLVEDISYLNSNCVCIATIADEKNDKVYWFVFDTTTGGEKSYILQYDKTSVTPVFVDIDNTVLKFNTDKITGINIIDNLLFFTDGKNEPKKINIDRCIAGTDVTGTVTTKLVVNNTQLSPITEKDITVIKPAPKNPLNLNYSYLRNPNLMHSGIMTISESASYPNSFLDSSRGIIHDFSSLSVGDYFSTIIETDINSSNDFTLSWEPFTNVVLKEFDASGNPPAVPISNFTIKGFITDWVYNEFTNTVEEIQDYSTNFAQGSGSVWIPTNTLTDPFDIYCTGVSGSSSENYKAGFQCSEAIVKERTYRIKYTIADHPVSGAPTGRLIVTLYDKDNDYIIIANHGSDEPSSSIYGISQALTPGDYEITVDGLDFWNNSFPNSTWPGQVNYGSNIVFEAKLEYEASSSSFVGDGFNGTVKDVTVERIDAQVAKVEIEITAIDGIPAAVEPGNFTLDYVIDAYIEEEGVFETKFPRFSYRYKYEDGEYSPFAPFTQPAFLPGNYQYDSVKGYNLAMANTIDSVTIKNINRDRPDDVTAIDLLYKYDGSTVVYLIDTLKDNQTEYKIDSEVINSAIPSNQMLRPWDNVPKTALAQEVVGNRIIYGNYSQNYDLINSQNSQNFVLDLGTKVISTQHTGDRGIPSIKSLREYQLGVVYTDKYGRETPVITNASSKIKLEKTASDDINEIVARINTFGHPINMDYFKFYIKDTGGDYYNLPMDRYYDAEDGNLWLAFPSVDRNKVTIDDFIILKKGVNTDELIKEQAKYKIVDIQNEAPEHIKKNEYRLSSKRHHDSNPLFNVIPVEGEDNFTVNKNIYNTSPHLSALAALFNNKSTGENWYISLSSTISNFVSKKYRILSMGTSVNEYAIQIDEDFGADVNDFADNPVNPTEILNNTRLNIYKEIIENDPKFDGRFFVKIYRDEVFNRVVQPAIDAESVEYSRANVQGGASRKLYYLSSATGNSTNLPKYHAATGLGNQTWLMHNGAGHLDAYDTPGDFPMGHSSTEPYGDTNANLKDYATALKNTLDQVGDWEYNNGTKLENNMFGYKAFFRGINTETDQKYTVGSSASTHGRVDKIDLIDDRENGLFEDVWYISDLRASDKRTYNNNGLVVNAQSPTTNSGSPDDYEAGSGGIYNASTVAPTIDLSFGGIEPNAWNSSNGWPMIPAITSFFDIENNNNNYSTQHGFANKLREGNQFRFKQDPTNTVYTIIDVVKYQSIIYDTLDEQDNQNPANNMNHYKAQHDVYNGIDKTYNKVADTGGNDVVYRSAPFFDASNFTVTYRLKLEKANNLNTVGMQWNPIESHNSPLSGGSEIELLAAEANPTVVSSSGATISLEVDTLAGIDAVDGVTKEIYPGLVLDSYDNVSDSNTNQAITNTAILSKIEGPVSGKYTLIFRSYLGQIDHLDTADSHGNIPNIASGDDLHFKQYGMNGLSPNSAKNLNFFRGGGDTKTGVDALGYEMEFVEPTNTRSQDQLLPTNPAIWETEQKETEDLEIYYEASKAYPIQSDPSQLQNLIPIGSTIEHLNSNVVPPGTTITAISVDGEITLSNEVLIDRQNLPYPAPEFDAF